MCKLKVGLVVSSPGNEDFSCNVGPIFVADARNSHPNAIFEIINLDEYPLPLFDQSNEVLKAHWPVIPSNTAALDWIRRIEPYDAILLIANGVHSYDLIFNGIDFIESELAYKPVDIIHVDDLEVKGTIDSLRLKLIEKQSICLWNGFEVTEEDLASRRGLENYFPADLTKKIDLLISDLIRVAEAMKTLS